MKKNKFGLQFDAKRMYDDLILVFIDTLQDTADELARQMMTRTRTDVVRQSIKVKLVWEAFDFIEAYVGSDHWQSFLDNYGTGSLMANESKNPYFAEYKQSKYWNEHRPSSNAVTAREAGIYTVPDWQGGDGYITRVSSGSIKAGTNLENISWGKNSNLRFTPKPPTFFIEHSMSFIKEVYKRKLEEVYNNFPFHKYLKGGV